MDLAEAEDIKKGWQEYIEELCKTDLNDPGNHDGVFTYLEPDSLKCKVKWALASITVNKVSGGEGIPAELFHFLKDNGVKVLRSIFWQIWKTQQCFPVTGLEKFNFHFNAKEGQCQRMFKLLHSCTHSTC